MIRLLAYMPTPGGLTGAPRRLLTLCGVLRDKGVEPCVASQSGSALIEAAAHQGHCTVEVEVKGLLALRHGALVGGGFIFRLRSIWALLHHNVHLRSVVREQRADVIWIRGSKGIAFAGLGGWVSGRPLIWDIDYELPSRGIVRWLHRFGLWVASAVVFQYEAAADEILGEALARRYQRKFTSIIPGIDFHSLEKAAARRSLRGQGEGTPFVILQVGTLCERKNQLLLIKALAHLKRSSADLQIRVWIAGGFFADSYVTRVKELIAAEGLGDIVELMGWRDDIHDLMASADLLVMPSKDEGVPNAVQEAMAIGLPVIVSNVGGMPEIVSHGKTGWVLARDDLEAWSVQIDICLREPFRCRAVGRAAASYAGKHFGIEKWGQKYTELICAVCHDRERR